MIRSAGVCFSSTHVLYRDPVLYCCHAAVMQKVVLLAWWRSFS